MGLPEQTYAFSFIGVSEEAFGGAGGTSDNTSVSTKGVKSFLTSNAPECGQRTQQTLMVIAMITHILTMFWFLLNRHPTFLEQTAAAAVSRDSAASQILMSQYVDYVISRGEQRCGKCGKRYCITLDFG